MYNNFKKGMIILANPYVWKMVKEAVENLNGKATNAEIKLYIKNKYGQVNDNTINCTILICSVNRESRINWPENSKPRIANSQYDFLYSTGRGQVELYNPSIHDQWEIREGADGRLVVCQLGTELMEKSTAHHLNDMLSPNGSDNDSLSFPLENHLRDFILRNLPSITIDGETLRLFVDDDGKEGREYSTEVGRIDILAVDDNENFIVFELKLTKGIDNALGQLLRYMGWVKSKLAHGKSVKGVIVADSIDEKLKYATSMVSDVSLFIYQVNFSLQKDSLNV